MLVLVLVLGRDEWYGDYGSDGGAGEWVVRLLLLEKAPVDLDGVRLLLLLMLKLRLSLARMDLDVLHLLRWRQRLRLLRQARVDLNVVHFLPRRHLTMRPGDSTRIRRVVLMLQLQLQRRDLQAGVEPRKVLTYASVDIPR